MPAPGCQARRILTRASGLLALVLIIATLVAGTALSASAAGPYTWDGGHDALGASEPAGSAYFAEGTTRNGFEEYLVLRNPGAKAAAVSINYLFGAGAPTRQSVASRLSSEVNASRSCGAATVSRMKSKLAA